MELIFKSGIFIYPIIAMSIFGLFIVIERTVFFLVELPKRRAMMQTLLNGTNPDCDNPDRDNPDCESDTFFMQIAASIKSGRFEDELIEIQVEKEVANAARFLSGLAVVVQSSPLLGLLGTVVGMIAAFVQIETLGEMVTPSDLAGGIWEALLTTAAGLIVAVPAGIAYTIFQSQAARYERWLLGNIYQIKSNIENKEAKKQ
ncbi:MotA/TolQ/ExbB proton channel family protein [bacterium]|nr:MotA/TolQ/ExbB proton channel family protein [bacterium]